MKLDEKQRKKIEGILESLTLDEKLQMIHGVGLFHTGGVERCGISPLFMSDGPMGVRNEFEDDAWVPSRVTDDYATYLPSNSAIAATWNRELAKKSGQVLGEEARARGKDVILAPGINIKRSPLCGRSFEYMSEDPCLTAGQCVPLIQGIQESDVAACVKHFALNDQEYNRLWVDTELSERALREIYLPAFQAAVQKGGSLSVMGAYNLVRGVRCCENTYLLDEILRKEWDYEGVLISDWGGIMRTEESALCSMDIEMSVHNRFDEYCFADKLKEAVKEGRVPQEAVDAKVRRILCMMEKLHMLDGKRKKGSLNTPQHREAALEVARESVVLLKNEENLLPLNPDSMKKLLVIGHNADVLHSAGGGSAEIKALYEISPLMGIRCLLGGNTQVRFVKGYDAPENQQLGSWQENSLEVQESKMPQAEKEKLERYREEAVRLAAEYEHVIFVGGMDHMCEVEGWDRPDMKLPYGQDQLIKEVLQANPNTVVVLTAGSPVEMGEWIDQAKAVVWNWYAGMENGTALAEVLFGVTNPSGKLPESFPVHCSDCSAHSIGDFGKKDCIVYREGIYVGYRHYEKTGIKPQFAFGHGLSYTTFRYDSMKTETTETSQGTRIKVTIQVTNTGMRAGKETVQLYTGAQNSQVDRPVKELRDYQKILLMPGECGLAVFELGPEAFSYYSEQRKQFVTDSGSYQIFAGSSSDDIRLQKEIFVSSVC